MLNDAALRDIATAETSRLLGDLVSGELTTTPAEHEGRWDPMLRRHVYSQSLTTWRKYGDVSILVGENGRVLAFQDKNRMDGAEYEVLDPDAVLQVCRTTGMLAKSAQIASSERGPTNLLMVVIEQKHHELPRRIRIGINAKLRLVAALQVLEDI